MINIFNTLYRNELDQLCNCDIIPWEKLENKKILITGATGLIGSYLVDLLMYRNIHYKTTISILATSLNGGKALKRFAPYSDNKLFSYSAIDLTKAIEVSFPVDYILHSASNANPRMYVEDPVGTLKCNITGVENLLRLCLNNTNSRLLYVSSGEVYGEGKSRSYSEDFSGYVNPLNPRSCYPVSKRAAENFCISHSFQYGTDTVIARPCHIYGPTMDQADNRAYAQFIRNALNKEDIVLKSKGLQYRSYCYVADCISALLLILLSGATANAYNISSRKSNTSVFNLASTIASVANKKIIFDLPTEQEEKGYSKINRSILNPGKLENLGWSPLYTLSKGIRNTIKILSDPI